MNFSRKTGSQEVSIQIDQAIVISVIGLLFKLLM
jgi:hypothetical protein